MSEPNPPPAERSFTSIIVLVVILAILFMLINNYLWKRDNENLSPVPNIPTQTDERVNETPATR